MKTFSFVAVLAAISVSSAGCFAAESKSIAAANQQLVDATVIDGKTSTNDLKAIYGEPFEIHATRYGVKWVYAFADRMPPSPSMKTVVVEFDQRGLAMSHSYQETRY